MRGLMLTIALLLMASPSDGWGEGRTPRVPPRINRDRANAPASNSDTSPSAVNSGAGQALLSKIPRFSIGPDVQLGDKRLSYLDTQIWQDNGLMCWQSGNDNTIWMCQLDPQTGDLIPPDGRGTKIAVGAPFTGNVLLDVLFGIGVHGTSNAAEWGFSQQGLGLYFTIEDENGVYQQAKCLLKNAPNLQVEQLTFGGTIDRLGNIPSTDANDPKVRLGYYEINQWRLTPPPDAFWQHDDPGAVKKRVPLDVFPPNGPRWIPGEHALLTYLYDADGTVQVASFNVDTDKSTFLTRAPGNHVDARILLDPDTGKQRYLVCLEDNHALAIYERVLKFWVKCRLIYPPPNAIADGAPDYRISQMKYFFYDGVLYIVYTVQSQFRPIPLCIASADGITNRLLTLAPWPLYHVDPEVYVGASNVFIYYEDALPFPATVRRSQIRRITLTFK
jgi:hypothetical protein